MQRAQLARHEKCADRSRNRFIPLISPGFPADITAELRGRIGEGLGEGLGRGQGEERTQRILGFPVS